MLFDRLVVKGGMFVFFVDLDTLDDPWIRLVNDQPQLAICTSSPTFGIRPSSCCIRPLIVTASSPKSTLEEVVDLPDFCASVHQDLVLPMRLSALR